MHLSFLTAMLAFILKRPLGKKGAILVGLVFIILYVFLAGPQPSLVRSAIMYIMGSFLVLYGYKRHSLALLGAAFLIQILWYPSSAYSVSFILSYLALGGILLLSNKTAYLLKPYLPASLANSLGASAGAFFVSAPAVIVFFGILRPAGIAAGLIAAPLSGIYMALSLAWLGAVNIPPNIPLLGIFPEIILDRLLGRLLFFMEWSISLFARLPGIAASPWAICFVIPVAAGILLLAKRQEQHRNDLAPFGL
jgi:competence protein ComEC